METLRKSRLMGSERTGINRRKSNRERKIALLQDVHISINLILSVEDCYDFFFFGVGLTYWCTLKFTG